MKVQAYDAFVVGSAVHDQAWLLTEPGAQEVPGSVLSRLT